VEPLTDCTGNPRPLPPRINTTWNGTHEFTIDQTPPILDFVSPTLDNQTAISNNWTYINVSSSETLDTCLLDWYNGTWQNLTMTVDGSYCYINMTDLNDYAYYFRVYGNDTVGNMNVTEDRQITVDSVYPLIEFVPPTPDDNTNQSQTWIDVNVSITETSDHSAFIDWNYSLVGWWSMDSYNQQPHFRQARQSLEVRGT
jgi:hypothetical protein